MPIQQRDPFSWADDYGRRAQQAGQNDSNSADNKLLAVFQEETRRQDPYFQAPLRMKLQENASNLALRNSMVTGAQRNEGANARRYAASIAPQKIVQTIEKASQAYGVDPDVMLTLADIESGFNPNAHNASGADGLFQFMPQTASEYGLTDTRDPSASSMSAAALTRDNAQRLKAAGIPPTAGNLYLAHQQGAGGAIKLLSNPNARADDIVGPGAIRQNGGRPGMSAGQFASLWTEKGDALYAQRKSARDARRGKTDQPSIQLTLPDLNASAEATNEASIALPDDLTEDTQF